jgi:hypothetical protein
MNGIWNKEKLLREISIAKLMVRVRKVEKKEVDAQSECKLFKKLPRGRFLSILGKAEQSNS